MVVPLVFMLRSTAMKFLLFLMGYLLLVVRSGSAQSAQTIYRRWDHSSRRLFIHLQTLLYDLIVAKAYSQAAGSTLTADILVTSHRQLLRVCA